MQRLKVGFDGRQVGVDQVALSHGELRSLFI